MSPRPSLSLLAGPTLRMQPDRRLARLASEGSEQAFEEIVRRYRPRLVAFAAAIVPAHRAEDIVQESLARVYTTLRANDGDVHLRAWLYTIVRNRALNAVRDERVHVELDEQHDGVTPPPEIVARRDEVAALVAGINALPEAQRQALVGRELEGLSHDEIAAQLGTSPASVRGLIFRARTALRHAAGALIPLPLVRWLAESSGSAGAGEAAAGGAAAAGILTAGGGGGTAVKAGAVVAAAALAAGAGVGLRDSGGGRDGAGDGAAQASEAPSGGGGSQGGASSEGGPGVPGQVLAPERGANGNRGEDGDDDRSGPGGGDDRSGPGHGGDDGDDDHSGPGGGGDDGGGHSGPGGGGGGDFADEDNSGPGGGGGGSSGSGSSGSGSSGSGSSGSGSSGSGSSGAGSSGSGSSGSGSDEEDETPASKGI